MTYETWIDGARWASGWLGLVGAVLIAWSRVAGHYITENGRRMGEGLVLLLGGGSGWGFARWLGVHDAVVMLCAFAFTAGMAFVCVVPAKHLLGLWWPVVVAVAVVLLVVIGAGLSE